MPAVQLVGPVRADHGEPFRAPIPGEECDHVPRRAVRPVQVLEHEEQRCALAEGSQERQETFEDPTLDPFRPVECAAFRTGARTQLGHEPAKLRGRG
jgi:hypothetical protein